MKTYSKLLGTGWNNSHLQNRVSNWCKNCWPLKFIAFRVLNSVIICPPNMIIWPQTTIYMLCDHFNELQIHTLCQLCQDIESPCYPTWLSARGNKENDNPPVTGSSPQWYATLAMAIASCMFFNWSQLSWMSLPFEFWSWRWSWLGLDSIMMMTKDDNFCIIIKRVNKDKWIRYALWNIFRDYLGIFPK